MAFLSLEGENRSARSVPVTSYPPQRKCRETLSEWYRKQGCLGSSSRPCEGGRHAAFPCADEGLLSFGRLGRMLHRRKV